MLKDYVRNIFVVICLSCTLFSCTVNNLTKVWQPWTRTFKNYDKSLPVKSSIVISIAGETKPMIGSETLLQDNIRITLNELFERRGYVVSNDTAQFTVKFNYRTERHDIIENTLESNTYVSSSSKTSAKEKSSDKISLFSSSSSSAENHVTSNTQSIESYNHVISVEIYNKMNELVFKGESSWDSKSQNIENNLRTSAQLILSSLPSDPDTYPRVPEVIKSKVENYFILKCQDKSFSCPALPYKIEFYQNYYYTSKVIVSDLYAFEAYTDLMLTADNALPKGRGKYSDPLNPNLWKSAQLGGKYYIGNSDVPKNILIDLDCNASGYRVTKCRIVSDEEFSEYENNLLKWKTATEEYYKLYQ